VLLQGYAQQWPQQQAWGQQYWGQTGYGTGGYGSNQAWGGYGANYQQSYGSGSSSK
jgi:hypothetical protein